MTLAAGSRLGPYEILGLIGTLTNSDRFVATGRK